MTIEEIMNSGELPKLYRVIKVDLPVLRCGFVNGGALFDCDDVAERKVRRVLCREGWKWSLVRECKNQEEWDYYFERDQECLTEVNAEFNLI